MKNKTTFLLLEIENIPNKEYAKDKIEKITKKVGITCKIYEDFKVKEKE